METTDIQIFSSVHGRDRRKLRDIGKHDLQAAVKYGDESYAFPHPVTGETRRKFTFANIVYITDETGTQEVTSWVEPVEIPIIPMSEPDLNAHETAKKRVIADPQIITSHSILVIDQSGSMKTCDVMDFKTRSDAAYGSVALDFIGEQLDKQECSYTDVVSLIEMRDSSAVVVFEYEPISNVLYNRIVRHMRETKPFGHGNYAPALKLAQEVLHKSMAVNSSAAMLLLFLSDGRPSDRVPPGTQSHIAGVMKEVQMNILFEIVDEMAMEFGERLSMGMIGFGEGSGDDEFLVLSEMAKRAERFGVRSNFSFAKTGTNRLSYIVSSVRSTFTHTRTMLTLLGGSKETRVLRSVSRLKSGDDSVLGEGWTKFPLITRWGLKTKWERGQDPWFEVSSFSRLARGVAVRKHILGEGSERLVYQLREYDWSGMLIYRVSV